KHTVFGMVSKGMDIVEAIANEKRDSGDWPINDVIIECEIVE
ncbi:MAG: peptidylprolyl isomerase, partial [Flavobacteriales bacterium]|nr:peptidylprolyl isomerase [Flavobacteriales bacterium]